MRFTRWFAINANEKTLVWKMFRSASDMKRMHVLSFVISTSASPTLVMHGLSFAPSPKDMYPPKPAKAPIPTLPIPAPDLLVVGAAAISIVDIVNREIRT